MYRTSPLSILTDARDEVQEKLEEARQARTQLDDAIAQLEDAESAIDTAISALEDIDGYEVQVSVDSIDVDVRIDL